MTSFPFTKIRKLDDDNFLFWRQSAFLHPITITGIYGHGINLHTFLMKKGIQNVVLERIMKNIIICRAHGRVKKYEMQIFQ
jgi:hypothetical protein